MSSHPRRHPGGFVSYLSVLVMGIVLLLLMINAYKSAMQAQETQASTTLRVDYAAKEEAVLRAVVPIAANRAMRGMQADSANNWNATSWHMLFRQAILEANAEESVDAALIGEFDLADAVQANPGDALTWSSASFRGIQSSDKHCTSGINRDFGPGFPPPLQTALGTVGANDKDHPLITSQKFYGNLAEGRVLAPVSQYPQFNLIAYPNIRFGYATPGQPFVAKRNWWTFRLDLSGHQRALTGAAARDRQFVFSIYEVPSQLAISAEAFTVIGQHGDGSAWENTSIQGGVYATRARIPEGISLDRISGRRGFDISESASIGDHQFAADPFAPGQREQFELENSSFLPVSLASEAGRAAFIPINRGVEFFDRYAVSTESNTLSPTTWNDYTIGARQCAMRLDVTDVRSSTDPTPTELTFSYMKAGERLSTKIRVGGPKSSALHPATGTGDPLPPGYIKVANQNQSYNFGTQVVDVAYGLNGKFVYRQGVSGSITFDNATFGNPNWGTFKAGYYRPLAPANVTLLHDTKPCIKVQPQRLVAFLQALGADSPAVNHSIAVNVDYVNNGFIQKPSIPCTELDYGVILEECADLRPFTKGFSLVTNLRLYIADDFNVMSTTPPNGSGLPSPFFPPCSLFAPEKRYGGEYDPLKLKLSGQLGSLAGDSGVGGAEVNLLDLKGGSELDLGHDDVEVNLAPISHPAALPPITMMNWLVVVEEIRDEYYTGRGVN